MAKQELGETSILSGLGVRARDLTISGKLGTRAKATGDWEHKVKKTFLLGLFTILVQREYTGKEKSPGI